MSDSPVRSGGLWSCVRERDYKTLFQLWRERDTESSLLIDSKDDLGRTPLHVSASQGCINTSKVLVAMGSEITTRDSESGWNALHRAAYLGRIRVLTYLLDMSHILGSCRSDGQPFSLLARDLDGNTPVDLLRIRQLKAMEHPRSRRLRVEIAQVTRWMVGVEEPSVPDDSDEEDCEGDVGYANGTHDNVNAEKEQPHDTEVYSWGVGTNFQLGTGKTGVQHAPVRVDGLPAANITQVSAAKFHSMFLTDAGEVYSCGFGRGGRLGTGAETTAVTPTLVKGLHGRYVTHVAAGQDVSLAITSLGHLYTWGSGLQTGHQTDEKILLPKKVMLPKDVHVVSADCGPNHCALVTKSGQVFTWGETSSGAMGHGVVDKIPFPRVVASFSHCVVTQAACGAEHTVAVTRQGKVYVMGYGRPNPKRVVFEKHELQEKSRWDFTAVSAGGGRCCALTSDGDVYVWDSRMNPFRPRMLRGLCVTRLASAPDFDMVVTDDGDLYTSLMDKNAQVNFKRIQSYDNTRSSYHDFHRVERLRHVDTVAAGEKHSIAVTALQTPKFPVLNETAKLSDLCQLAACKSVDSRTAANLLCFASQVGACGEVLRQYSLDYVCLNIDTMLLSGCLSSLAEEYPNILREVEKRYCELYGIKESASLEEDDEVDVSYNDELIVEDESPLLSPNLNPHSAVSSKRKKKIPKSRKEKGALEPKQGELQKVEAATDLLDQPQKPTKKSKKQTIAFTVDTLPSSLPPKKKSPSVAPWMSPPLEEIRDAAAPGPMLPPPKVSLRDILQEEHQKSPQTQTQTTSDEIPSPTLGQQADADRRSRTQSDPVQNISTAKSPLHDPIPLPGVAPAVSAVPEAIRGGKSSPRVIAFGLSRNVVSAKPKAAQRQSPAWQPAPSPSGASAGTHQAVGGSPSGLGQPHSPRTESRSKSLREIQEEQETQLRELKQKGWSQPESILSQGACWGLTPERDAKTLLQIQQEEERKEEERQMEAFIDEQRKILAAIEAENAKTRKQNSRGGKKSRSRAQSAPTPGGSQHTGDHAGIGRRGRGRGRGGRVGGGGGRRDGDNAAAPPRRSGHGRCPRGGKGHVEPPLQLPEQSELGMNIVASGNN